ncbi:3-deoxy-D-manno-octulosonic-acid transferase [Succinivibrio dextrinosolvens]|uniref:3-deoxy-D-manno-octulosonic acid transferase n=1 Tax=Succinivibrio dextrinosolvens TaxID=83771 RepID=UPI0008EEB923|nr:3-deoxy-D-manno-octulosonic acid transferase [Succinivibrio dextrinosolvens]SFS43846.1 3-deoxy-D-manno-octulosonic-acid transferase [Succinivibrio dextrinosolvens]
MKLSSRFALYLYKFVTLLIAPLGAAFLAYKKRRDPPYGRRIFELLGYYRETEISCIWFHGASVGEINALKPFIVEFRRNHPNDRIVITTMTTTGAKSASSLENVLVKFSPLDSPLAVSRFFKHFNPEALIIIDTELWPNMLDIAAKRKCPVMIINARMQEKNCQKYLKHKNLVQDLIGSKLSKVMCISYADKDRFEKIGVPARNTVVTGNIKYDLKPRERMFEDSKKIRRKILSENVFGAISIHDGEEEAVVNAYIEARKTIPDLKMVFVPRHQTVTDSVCSYLNDKGISFALKSELKSITLFNADVMVGDTMGEIETYFGLCDLIFMGGSLVDIGGHNPLEPAYFSLPLLTGPIYRNFEEQFEKLLDTGGCFVAEDEHKLALYIIKLLSDRNLLQNTGVMALDVQQQGKGALNRTIEQLDLMLFKN